MAHQLRRVAARRARSEEIPLFFSFSGVKSLSRLRRHSSTSFESNASLDTIHTGEAIAETRVLASTTKQRANDYARPRSNLEYPRELRFYVQAPHCPVKNQDLQNRFVKQGFRVCTRLFSSILQP
ncbi:unnamed protein product [Ectocarpus fasciculatus]